MEPIKTKILEVERTSFTVVSEGKTKFVWHGVNGEHLDAVQVEDWRQGQPARRPPGVDDVVGHADEDPGGNGLASTGVVIDEVLVVDEPVVGPGSGRAVFAQQDVVLEEAQVLQAEALAAASFRGAFVDCWADQPGEGLGGVAPDETWREFVAPERCQWLVQSREKER